MRRVCRTAIALATAVGALMFTGCSIQQQPGHSPSSSLTPVETTPSDDDTFDPTEYLDANPAGNMLVKVFGVDAYEATKGCDCTLPNKEGEAFPKGNEVRMYRIVLESEAYGADDPDEQDLEGLEVTAHFQGQEVLAVSDDNDGPVIAQNHGVPWKADGAFKGTDWSMPHETPTSFAVAYYVPAGENFLDLSVEIPSVDWTFDLTVPVNPKAEGNE